MNLYDSLVLRSMREEGFREKLRKDPRGVLSAEGVDVPASVKVELHELPADTVTLVVSTDGQVPEAVHALADIQMEQEVPPPTAGTERDWLRDSLGLEVDHSGPIRLLWNTATIWNIAVPCAGGELDIAELEEVAGGTSDVSYRDTTRSAGTNYRVITTTTRNQITIANLSPGRSQVSYRVTQRQPDDLDKTPVSQTTRTTFRII